MEKKEKAELRTHVAREHDISEDKLIWSPKCGNPLTQRRNQELKTIEMDKGYWVKK